MKHGTDLLAPECLSAFLKDFLNCRSQFFPMFGIEAVIPFVPLDVVVKGSPRNIQCFAENMNTKLAIERFQYRKLLLCCSVGDRRNGFQNRDNLFLLFAAAEKAVKVFWCNSAGTVLRFNRPMGLNPSVKGTSGNLVLLADLYNRLSVVI